ncbi:hypothetical protein CCR75_005121 [Bremia lactucae]|uniref:UDENN domain-containing protein n=1 Tax=Bremia lactucae TaxID=4779 RepID=A0A976FEK7_BRELC|nr:hypothetical protein CCR75_005121 [Bremia lactucae]
MSSDAKTLKLLLLSDLGGQLQRVNQLCEKMVSSDDCDVIAVLVSGGMVDKQGPPAYETREALAAAEGDMMALISRLEMIICRVIYIPNDNDPPTTRSITESTPSLTQYSSNVYYQDECLIEGVNVMGEARYFELINDGKNPMQDGDMVLVLRDSAAKTQLPTVESNFFASLLPMLQSSKQPIEPCALEIIGGSNQHPHAQLPLIYPGSLRLGQYTILQLEKDLLEEKWRTPSLGTGNWDVRRDTPSLWKQKLKAPSRNSHELRVCKNSTRHEILDLKPNHGHEHFSANSPLVTTRMTEEREKRRRSTVVVKENNHHTKRHKDRSYSMSDTNSNMKEGKEKAPMSNQRDKLILPEAIDSSHGLQMLVQKVAECMASKEPLHSLDWVGSLSTSLQVPALLDLAMPLNVTVDALAAWARNVDSGSAHEIQTQKAALILEVVANLPPGTSELNVSVTSLPGDEVLSKSETEVKAVIQAENEALEHSAYARANAAKRVIECLSSACKAYMDLLAGFAQADDQSSKVAFDVTNNLEAMSQRVTGLLESCTRDVKKAEALLCEAKQTKEARSLQIVEFVNARRNELLEQGETEACATLESIVGIWKKDDANIQALWTACSDGERQVKESKQALTVAEKALAFYQNLCTLFQSVLERREAALTSSLRGLDNARTNSAARATAALEMAIPMLTRAVYRYFDFHAVQQAKATEELLEQEAALAAHKEFFGDSAPIKKGDIEQRIREFMNIRQNSLHVVAEIAEKQQYLWKDKQAVLPQVVRDLLVHEYRALWVQLSGPMQDVMKQVVTTIEQTGGGAVAIQLQQHQQPSSKLIVAKIDVKDLNEQIVPAFIEPVFLDRCDETRTPYRTAISAIMAPKENLNSMDVMITNDTKSSGMTCGSTEEGSVPTHLTLSKPPEFDVGSILYSKITTGTNCTQFVRGVVLERLDNGLYVMQYDNGDKFSVKSSFLFTKELMEQSLKENAPNEDVEMKESDNGSRCDSCHREMSVADDAWLKKLEQLQNELALAQYEAQKWKEKYLVEKTRRQKIARDLLNLVVRTEPISSKNSNVIVATEAERSFSNTDHTANLLSPTLSSFDFDDDSSEEDSDDTKNHRSEALLSLQDRASNKKEGVLEVPEKNYHQTEFQSSFSKLKQQDRESFINHSDAETTIPGRAGRSSTTGSVFEALGESSQRQLNGKSKYLQQQRLMYRIMYLKPLQHKLWTRSNGRRPVAHSIRFSMNMKKERIFERFFVTGLDINEASQHQESLNRTKFWKPHVLYDFPDDLNGPPDEFIADFCFPKGVPLTTCTPEQAASIQGLAVSKWYTDFRSLQNHVKKASDTSGYTFRLTGAKGEILYGFCVAIMHKVAADIPLKTLESPNTNTARKKDVNSTLSSSTKRSRTCVTSTMAPICYCITSKFPFYRLYFTLLRLIAENELEQSRLASATSVNGSPEAKRDEEYEVIIKPLLDLAIELAVHHEEGPNKAKTSSTTDTSNMLSIASKLKVTLLERKALLSEDATILIGESQPRSQSTKPASHFRKSFSTDDIAHGNLANGPIVDKFMVKRIDSSQPKEYERVQVGDILEATDSIATTSMSLNQTLVLLDKGNRPLRLRFRRPVSSTSLLSRNSQFLLASSIDILHRARRIQLNDPGHWSSVRLPTFNFSYQFPKRASDHWSVGVMLRFLSPDQVVEIVAYLLLEKQVVIMSDSPAKISAVCTALLLMLAPFQWQSTYIPLLPFSLLAFLHSPVPFLVGCHSLLETTEWGEVCFYDIDKNQVSVSERIEHLGPSSIPNGIEFSRLLHTAKARFCALRPTGTPWYELSQEQETVITLTMQEAEILLSDLGFDISCQDVTASIAGSQSFYDRLQEKVAKEVRKSNYEDYLDEFTQTQLFCQYYESLLKVEAQKEQHD